MRVALATHGGLAAGIFQSREPAVVDTAMLGDADAREITALVAAATAAGGRTRPGTPSGADAMAYTITVENGDTHVLRQSDTSMTPEFAALLTWLQSHAPDSGS